MYLSAPVLHLKSLFIAKEQWDMLIGFMFLCLQSGELMTMAKTSFIFLFFCFTILFV